MGLTKKEKAARAHEILNELHAEVPVPLDHVDSFTLLIAVLLSAQTTDARVNLVTPALFKLGLEQCGRIFTRAQDRRRNENDQATALLRRRLVLEQFTEERDVRK